MSKIAIPSRATYKVRNPATEESLFIGSNRAIINAHQMHHALKRMQNRSHQASSHYKVKGLGSPFKTSHQQEIWLETIIDNFNNNLKHIKTMCKFENQLVKLPTITTTFTPFS